MAKITTKAEWLEDSTGLVIAPNTLLECVFNSSGTNLKTLLSKVLSVDLIETKTSISDITNTIVEDSGLLYKVPKDSLLSWLNLDSIEIVLSALMEYFELNTPLMIDDTTYLIDNDKEAFIVDDDLKSQVNSIKKTIANLTNSWPSQSSSMDDMWETVAVWNSYESSSESTEEESTDETTDETTTTE